MRIIAGVAGGLTLKSVPGENTRPTADRVKEALFSRLESYNHIVGAQVLDLFAGTGALGLEAASRGAARVVLVDRAQRAIDVLENNVALVTKALAAREPAAIIEVHRAAASQFLARMRDGGDAAAWDLVFLDPPYPMSNSEVMEILILLADQLAQGAIVVLERSRRSGEPDVPASLEHFANKTYGETTLWFLEPA